VTRRINIAIDGPAGAGKGTVARGVARALGYAYVDTGAMYRAVALAAKARGVEWTDADGVAAVARGLAFAFPWDGDVLRVVVDDDDVTSAIRSDEAGRGASVVSAHPPVRAALLGLQRALGHQGGVVMDGRDIGTVVIPDAELKVFLEADLDERARRRHEELLERGVVVSFHEVRDSIATRDRQDASRDTAPMVAAADAQHVDTTNLTIRQAIDRVLGLAVGRIAEPD
jgi:cytidylate kinase